MTLQLDSEALDLAGRRVGVLHEELLREQAALSREIDQLLDTRWTGTAAGQFRSAWQQWCRGMRDVLTGVGMEGDAIALTRAELVGLDAERAAAGRRLHERLGRA